MKKWMMLAALLLMAAPLWAQQDMVAARPEVRQLLSEQTAKFWTDAQIDTAWNRAQMQVGLLSGVLVQQFATIRTLKDTATYGVAGGKGLGSYYYKIVNIDSVTTRPPVRLRSVFIDSSARQPVFLTIVDNPGSIPYLSSQTQPTYCWLHDSILAIYPKASAEERVQINYYAQTRPLPADTSNSDLPTLLQPAAIWLAGSFLMNQDYKYDVSDRYYKRALDLVAAYRATFQMQTEAIRGQELISEPQK